MGSPLCCSVDICSCLFLRGLQGNKSASHDFLYREISVVPGELPSPLTDIHRALLSVFFQSISLSDAAFLTLFSKYYGRGRTSLTDGSCFFWPEANPFWSQLKQVRSDRGAVPVLSSCATPAASPTAKTLPHKQNKGTFETNTGRWYPILSIKEYQKKKNSRVEQKRVQSTL